MTVSGSTAAQASSPLPRISRRTGRASSSTPSAPARSPVPATRRRRPFSRCSPPHLCPDRRGASGLWAGRGSVSWWPRSGYRSHGRRRLPTVACSRRRAGCPAFRLDRLLAVPPVDLRRAGRARRNCGRAGRGRRRGRGSTAGSSPLYRTRGRRPRRRARGDREACLRRRAHPRPRPVRRRATGRLAAARGTRCRCRGPGRSRSGDGCDDRPGRAVRGEHAPCSPRWDLPARATRSTGSDSHLRPHSRWVVDPDGVSVPNWTTTVGAEWPRLRACALSYVLTHPRTAFRMIDGALRAASDPRVSYLPMDLRSDPQHSRWLHRTHRSVNKAQPHERSPPGWRLGRSGSSRSS